MVDFNTGTRWIVIIALTAAALGYVFLGADIIPDSLSALPPTTVLGWVDDSIAILTAILIGRRWWRYTKGQGDEGVNVTAMIIFVAVASASLFYVFWGVDLIPDATPWVGFADDAIAVAIGVFTAARLRKGFG